MTKEQKDGFFVDDRRHWASVDPDEGTMPAPAPPAAPPPVDAERLRQALAELEGAKARLARDAEKQLELERSRILEALLPVLDNLDRSISAAAQSGQSGPFLDGVKLVQQQFLATLAPFGLQRRSTVGERFNPRVHDAVAIIPVPDRSKDGVVVAEVEPAYVVGGRVIRPAKVQVGRAAERGPS
jgi:molecular chaperone GrpE (heat shock protein)